jgi:hypothetical protein
MVKKAVVFNATAFLLMGLAGYYTALHRGFTEGR